MLLQIQRLNNPRSQSQYYVLFLDLNSIHAFLLSLSLFFCKLLSYSFSIHFVNYFFISDLLDFLPRYLFLLRFLPLVYFCYWSINNIQQFTCLFVFRESLQCAMPFSRVILYFRLDNVVRKVIICQTVYSIPCIIFGSFIKVLF